MVVAASEVAVKALPALHSDDAEAAAGASTTETEAAEDWWSSA